MSDIVIKIVMIVLLSALFPMAGFFLDYRAKRKQFERKKQ